MATREVKAKITLDDQLTPGMAKALKGLEDFKGGVVSLAAGMQLLEKGAEIATQAFEFLERQFERAIDEALEAEKANNRLKGALVATGQYTAQAAYNLDKYTESLELNVGANGETVKSMIATGVQMGLSVDKSKELEQAARQLAAANGIDVTEAFSALQASLAGNQRALAKMVPQVKEFTAAQLKQGVAIDLVNESTKTQYEIYQTSLPAAFAKGSTAINNIYKAFGEAFVDNASVKAAIGVIVGKLQQFAEWADEDKDSLKKLVSDGVLVFIDSLAFLNSFLDVTARAGVMAFESLRGGITLLNLGFTTLIGGPIALFYKALSYLPGEAGKGFNAAADAIGAKMTDLSASYNKSASNIDTALNKQTETSKTLEAGLLKLRETVLLADAAEQKSNKTKDESLEKDSKAIAAKLALADSYAGISIGTDKDRKALEAAVSDRDKDLKEFKTYLDNKSRLAVSQAAEQEMEVNKVRASALKGAGGSTEAASTAQAAIDEETKKQAGLAAARDAGIISKKEYDLALLTSTQQMHAAEDQMNLAHETAKADLLGESEAGFQLKQQLAQDHFNIELADKIARAEAEGATEAEQRAMREAENQEHLATMAQQEDDFYNKKVAQQVAQGNQFDAFLARMQAAQKKHGAVMGTLISVTQSEEYKAVGKGLDNLATLRSGKSKAQFEIGRAAAVAGAIINTAQAAIAALAPPPLGVGPLLGAALAGTVIAAGALQIGNIAAQQYPGGQADSGMDSIPQALGGRSFILSAGERVVQPTANKDLTDFLNKDRVDNSGGASNRPTMVNITINGKMDAQDADQAVDTMIAALRRASEKGTPIISERGIVKNLS